MNEINLSILTTPLIASEIEFRVSHCVKGKNEKCYAFLLAYKTSRTDMQKLDEAVGAMNWQISYERDSKGVLKCSISIYDTEKGQWVQKTSNGTESNTEAEKGEYSDAMKRAGFMWGIGRQLYDFPSVIVELKSEEMYLKNDKITTTGKFRPNDWSWVISGDYKQVKALQGQEIRFETKK